VVCATLLKTGLLACGVVMFANMAEAKHIKYTYLKIGEGPGAPVYALPSMKVCEAKAREWRKFNEKIYRDLTKAGTNPDKPMRVKCLSFLPYGYIKPKDKH
jgi:hypothetical protein